MLKVKCNITAADFSAFLLKAEKYIAECMKEALVNLCKECDTMARTNDGGWRNVSGNLRSSIGGAVYEHGKAYFTTSFETILNGREGSSKGRRMVQELASQYTEAVSMVIVAGMEYADVVEAVESKDVLESTRIYAENEVRGRLEAAKEKAIKEINTWKL